MTSTILTLVAAVAAPQLGRDLSPFGRVAHAQGANDATRELEGGTVSWFVIDPTLLRLDVVTTVIAAATRAGAAVLVQLALTDDGVERLLELLQHQSVEVHFESPVPGSVRTLAYLGRPPVVSLPSKLLHGIAPRLLRLPSRVRTLVAALLCTAPGECTTKELIVGCAVSRRTIDRWLSAATLASLARVERVARVARSWEHLTHVPMSLGAIADRTGFGAERTLSAAWQATCNISPRRAGLTMNAQQVLVRLVDSIAAIPSGSNGADNRR